MQSHHFLLASLLLAGWCIAGCAGSGTGSGSAADSIAAVGDTAPSLQKQWETDTTVRAPESALWDPQASVLYVSNIDGDGAAKDGQGFISKLDADGQITDLHWVEGLNAAKGLGLYEGKLYVADLDQLVIIDVAAGKIVTRVDVPGATFLNDITIDDAGRVYVSDSRQNKVYRYADGKIAPYLEQPEMKGVNGLLAWKGRLWILAAGGIYTYDEASGQLQLFSDGVKGGDGLAAVNDSDLIASRWVGEVYYVRADGTATQLLDTKDAHKNTADITYIPEKSLLVVPTFLGNTLAGYTLTR